jgi:O-glycosyl hydrolase
MFLRNNNYSIVIECPWNVPSVMKVVVEMTRKSLKSFAIPAIFLCAVSVGMTNVGRIVLYATETY